MNIVSTYRRKFAAIARATALAAAGALVAAPILAGAAQADGRWTDGQWREDERRGERRSTPFVGYGHQRTQSGELVPAPGSPEPRYPHGAKQVWIPGHFVGGYMRRDGVWVHRRWVPGRTVIISDLE